MGGVLVKDELPPLVAPGRDRGGEQGEPTADGLDATRLLLRFAIGVVELGGERLAATLRQFEAERRAAPALEPPAPASGRHVVLGALCAAPEWLSRKLHPHPSLVPVRRPGNRWGRLARRAPGVARAQRYATAVGARARTQLLRWAEAGVREEQQARGLARLAVEQLFANAMSRVAQSPELKTVIEQQSEGLTTSAMNELRESSARADRMVESVTGRLFGRRPR